LWIVWTTCQFMLLILCKQFVNLLETKVLARLVHISR
jgi:hypothetical protein